MLGILRRNFKEMDVESFISLYKVFVRSHLEYAESVWMYLTDDLEKVQKTSELPAASEIFESTNTGI